MSKIKLITVHNNERAVDGCGEDYVLTIRPLEHRMDWRDRSGNALGKNRLTGSDFDTMLDEIKRWMLGAGPEDVTYYGQFKTQEEYAEWCAALLCEDHEVLWDVQCEYTDGSCAVFICADSRPFPAPFASVIQKAVIAAEYKEAVNDA